MKATKTKRLVRTRNVANDQAMTWLRSMANSENVFDAINAQNCLAMIEKERKAYISLGAHFCNLKKQRDRYAKIIDEARRNACDCD